MFISFNKPSSNEDNSDNNIQNFIELIFNSCEQNSEVNGTIYKWSGQNLINRISAIAQNKNLSVNLFSGGLSTEPFTEINFGNNGSLKKYNTDSDGKMNHNKLIIFKNVNFKKLRDDWSGPI